jgi:hypothetical protein
MQLNEEKRKSAILEIDNFERIKTNSAESAENAETRESTSNGTEVITNIPLSENENQGLLEGGSQSNMDVIESNPESITDNDNKPINEINSDAEAEIALNVEAEPDEEPTTEPDAELEVNAESDVELYAEQTGGASGYIDDGQVYEIDYLVANDKELINILKVNTTVDRYINNYYSEEMKKYKQSFKTLYQKYGNKRFVIHNIGNVITFMKNDKKKEVVMELNKPVYFYYNVDSNLEKLKRDVSNKRADLQYSYQTLVNKINVDMEEKKQFEKERKKFIDFLEIYYIYSLYHKKINKISNTNKITLMLQELLSESKKLDGNLYSIDNTTIDLINKQNAEKLNEFNTLVSRIQSIKNITNNKEIIENIKQYINNTDITKLLYKIKEQAKMQDNYVDYIVMKLP